MFSARQFESLERGIYAASSHECETATECPAATASRALKRRERRAPVAFALVALLFQPHSLLACAACYGQSDSALAQGMNWGIMTLLAILGVVFSGIIVFFVHVGRKSAAANPPQ
jgi:hypothetical protein